MGFSNNCEIFIPLVFVLLYYYSKGSKKHPYIQQEKRVQVVNVQIWGIINL